MKTTAAPTWTYRFLSKLTFQIFNPANMRFSTYTTASVLATLASAQTFTDCNPLEKTCPNDPAMPQTWETDFTAGKDAVKGWKQKIGRAHV